MAPYRYDPYVDRSSGTLGALILNQGRIKANTIRDVGYGRAATAGAIGAGVANVAGAVQQERLDAPRREMEALQLNAARTQARDEGLLRTALAMAPNGDYSEAAKFLRAQGAAGIPALQKLSSMAQQQQEQHDEAASLLGYQIVKAGNSPDAVHAALSDAVQKGALHPDDAQRFHLMTVEQPEKIPELAKQLLARSKWGRDQLDKVQTFKDGETGINPLTGSTVVSVPPKPPTPKYQAKSALLDGQPAELSFDEATGKYVQNGEDVTGRVTPLQPTKAPASQEEQYLEALTTGNTAKANLILKGLRETAAAKRDPAAQALAAQLAGLRTDEAKVRLDALKKKAEPLDVSPDVQTTRAGRSYLDLSAYQGEERNKARDAANAVGAVGVSKEQADALQNIDNARMNQQSILDQVKDLLPQSVGGRGVAALTVPLQKLFQTNEQIAAFNSWRTAAIQTMRATAGSKGLRINRSEIEQAIENDIPKLTDTVATAQQKVKNVNTMLENAERSILIRDRQADQPQAGSQPPAANGLTPALQSILKR